MAARRRRRRRRTGSLAQGTCAAEGEGYRCTEAFPIPLCPGPRLLDGQPGPAPGQPGSQQLVGALEPLGRHGDAPEVRVPKAQDQGLNLHNLPARRVGVGPARPWPEERSGPGRGLGSLWLHPPPTHSGCKCRAASTWAPQPTTRYSPDSDPGSLGVASAYAVSAGQAGGRGLVGSQGLEFI